MCKSRRKSTAKRKRPVLHSRAPQRKRKAAGKHKAVAVAKPPIPSPLISPDHRARSRYLNAKVKALVNLPLLDAPEIAPSIICHGDLHREQAMPPPEIVRNAAGWNTKLLDRRVQQ